MNLIVPDWPDLPDNVRALTTARSGGFSSAPYDDGDGKGGFNLGTHVGDDVHAVLQNRAQLRAIVPSEPAWLTQIHGVTVVDAATVGDDAPRADASVATRPGVVCTIQTADCLPVLFCDSRGATVGAAHAGWRGLVHGVLENTVRRMRDAGAGELMAWLGPAIGPQHFEVGEDVRAAFIARDEMHDASFKPISNRPGKYLADIYLLARNALTKTGIEQIYGGDFCTVMDHDRFFSYRRDKTTGRMASLIWIKP
jgi:YfiH family protein